MTGNETWTIGDVTVTLAIERHTMLAVGDFLPTATDERLAAHQSWLRPWAIDDEGRLLFVIQALCVQAGGRQDRRRHLRGSDVSCQISTRGWSTTARSSTPSPPPASDTTTWTSSSAPSPLRSRRLEHRPRGRQVGTDVPEGAVPRGPNRARILEANYGRRASGIQRVQPRRCGLATLRSGGRRPRRRRSPGQRRDPPHPDSRAYARSRLRADLLARGGGPHHR